MELVQHVYKIQFGHTGKSQETICKLSTTCEMMIMKQPVKVILNISPVYGSLVDGFSAVMNPPLCVAWVHLWKTQWFSIEGRRQRDVEVIGSFLLENWSSTTCCSQRCYSKSHNHVCKILELSHLVNHVPSLFICQSIILYDFFSNVTMLYQVTMIQWI